MPQPIWSTFTFRQHEDSEEQILRGTGNSSQPKSKVNCKSAPICFHMRNPEVFLATYCTDECNVDDIHSIWGNEPAYVGAWFSQNMNHIHQMLLFYQPAANTHLTNHIPVNDAVSFDSCSEMCQIKIHWEENSSRQPSEAALMQLVANFDQVYLYFMMMWKQYFERVKVKSECTGQTWTVCELSINNSNYFHVKVALMLELTVCFLKCFPLIVFFFLWFPFSNQLSI